MPLRDATQHYENQKSVKKVQFVKKMSSEEKVQQSVADKPEIEITPCNEEILPKKATPNNDKQRFEEFKVAKESAAEDINDKYLSEPTKLVCMVSNPIPIVCTVEQRRRKEELRAYERRLMLGLRKMEDRIQRSLKMDAKEIFENPEFL